MRLPGVIRSPGTAELPLWPPLLATRGPGGQSDPHAHHAVHLVLATAGQLRMRRSSTAPWTEAAGVLSAPDVPHAIDARGTEVLLVFLDPESDAGAALVALAGGALRAISAGERDRLVGDADPGQLVRAGGAVFTARAVQVLGGPAPAVRRIHPRVRKLLRLLRDTAPEDDVSLEALAAEVGLSPGRLMHVFTASIGLPLRPYLAWLKLQRAAGAIVTGSALADAAHAAGFADAAHMTRTFRRMFGITPSALRGR